MDPFTCFQDAAIRPAGPICRVFLDIGIDTFFQACRYVHELPYGYNTDRDDLMILFKERFGSCTTKHAVIATLAAELNLPITKSIGIYPMTDEIVTGTGRILESYKLPYLPMVHCFLTSGQLRVDLTEGNHNGKNRPLDHFLFTQPVEANISAKDEYRLYRRALEELVTSRQELQPLPIKTILQARQEGLELLRSKVSVDVD